MTQVWPGFGDAPVPGVVSMICKPEGVVMVFPAVCAAAVVGTHACDAAKTVITIAANIGSLACWRRRIVGTFRFGSEACLAQRDWCCYPFTAVIPGRPKGEPQMCNCTSGNLEIPGSMRSLSSGRALRGPVGIARNDGGGFNCMSRLIPDVL